MSIARFFKPAVPKQQAAEPDVVPLMPSKKSSNKPSASPQTPLGMKPKMSKRKLSDSQPSDPATQHKQKLQKLLGEGAEKPTDLE